MKKRDTRRSILAATGVASLLTAAPVNSQSGGTLELTQSTLDAGGGRSAAGTLVMTGTVGQLDASQQSLSAGTINLVGGFWGQPGDFQPPDLLFFNGFESDQEVEP